MLGPWAGFRAQPGEVITLRSALAQRAAKGGFKLVYAKGTEVWGDSESGFAEAVDAARRSDLVVMALGEDAPSSGEAGSRVHLDLPGNQQKLLEAVVATGKPIVLVLFSGRPLVLTPVAPKVSALLEAWFPGTEAGPAITRVLFGDADFTGRLTVSFPRAVGQEPIYYNALSTGRPPDGIDLTHRPRNPEERYHSRYIDELNSPLFPFGYGLSYAKFSFSPVALSAKSVSASEMNSGKAAPLKVSAEVRNLSNRAGTEVVQLYLREQGTSVERPVRELQGFQSIAIGPGMSKRVEFTLGRDELKFWNAHMEDVVEPARVTVWVGPSSAEGSEAKFEITK